MSIEDVFTNFPPIETERLILRQIQESDTEAMFALFSDEQVMEFSGGKFPHRSVEESREFIRKLGEWYKGHECIEWGITRKGNDTLIGTCGFHGFGEGFHRAEIGYELLPAYWRQGIMSEALQAIVTFAFATMGLSRIEAIVDEGNERSQGILLKLGFTHEGTLRQRFFFRDRFWDEHHFGFLKSEWKVL
jgi:ribosomal-protein-alanine N-acetyltransferase